MTETLRRPGIARADRRELRLLRDWLSSPDEPGLGEALVELLDPSDPSAVARFAAIQRLVAPPTRTWSASRGADSLVFREHGIDAPIELRVHDDTKCTIMICATTAALEVLPDETAISLDDAIDAATGSVLAWVRRHGAPPQVASRLAALFAP